jgi:hypothetical protein
MLVFRLFPLGRCCFSVADSVNMLFRRASSGAKSVSEFESRRDSFRKSIQGMGLEEEEEECAVKCPLASCKHLRLCA